MREARKNAGLTQQALADLLGVHQPTVAQWESGLVGPRLDTARRVAAALSTTVDELWPEADRATTGNGTEAEQPKRESERTRRRREWNERRAATEQEGARTG